jgi:hypothetical protein
MATVTFVDNQNNSLVIEMQRTPDKYWRVEQVDADSFMKIAPYMINGLISHLVGTTTPAAVK